METLITHVSFATSTLTLSLEPAAIHLTVHFIGNIWTGFTAYISNP